MASLQLLVLTVAGISFGETVLLDFTATWCGPCQQMSPVVEELHRQGHPVRKVDVDQHPILKQKYQVQGIPCFVMLVNGQVVDRQVGATSKNRLLQMLAKAKTAQLPTPSAQRTVPARAIAMPSVAADSPLKQESSDRSFGDALQRRLMAASVRLKVNDPQGNSFGSGTIIDVRGGMALVLTCGHLFRDSKGGGTILIDMFSPGGTQGVPAQLVGYDLDRDVGLVAFRPGTPVTPVSVAGKDFQVKPGTPVISIGCDNGRDPSIRRSRVTSINKYQGPPNLQAAGQPVVGRSGGGLFTAEGYLVGVCNAADPMDNEGLYAAAGSIYAELDRRKLSHVYQQPRRSGADALVESAAPPQMPRNMPSISRQDPFNQPQRRELSQEEQTAQRLLETQQAEMVFVVRDPGNPNGAPRIIRLSQGTPEILQQLSAMQQAEQARIETSHRRMPRNHTGPSTNPRMSPPSEMASPWRPRWSSPAIRRQ